MVYHIMHKNKEVATVSLSSDRRSINIIKYEPDGIKQPFSGPKITVNRFYDFLKSRCYDDGRADLDDILKRIGLENNNPYEFVKYSHGVTYDDFIWIKFDNEDLTWEDVCIR